MLKNKCLFRILGFVATICLANAAQAKDLTHRLGIGYRNSSSIDLPSVTAVYNSTVDLAFIGGVGIDTQKDYARSMVTGGMKYMIYPETNMNFYGAGLVSLLNSENPVDGKKSGVEVSGLFGVEFFLTGLENLGFNFEAGLALSTLQNSRFRTVGHSPLQAGMTFYF